MVKYCIKCGKKKDTGIKRNERGYVCENCVKKTRRGGN